MLVFELTSKMDARPQAADAPDSATGKLAQAPGKWISLDSCLLWHFGRAVSASDLTKTTTYQLSERLRDRDQIASSQPQVCI